MFNPCAVFLQVHTELVGSFFHSGPQLIVQLGAFWTGIYTHDLQVNSKGKLFLILNCEYLTVPFSSVLKVCYFGILGFIYGTTGCVMTVKKVQKIGKGVQFNIFSSIL